ncbi:MAG: prepilin-type N-terminal cleavage/methylation domain-containing protein [Planctomycetota bacterium]
MANHSRNHRGFTLVEVVVVIAVVLLLTGIAVPMISGYVEDGKRVRAKAEANVISSAIASFYKDLAVWPTRNAAGTNNTLYALYSGKAMPVANPFLSAHNWDTWARSATVGDLLDNHLVRNSPQGAIDHGYPTEGEYRWRGPYLPKGSTLDPWARPYVVFVRSVFDASATNYKKLVVLSAGPDGRIETPYQARSNQEISGDDEGIVLFMRN